MGWKIKFPRIDGGRWDERWRRREVGELEEGRRRNLG
jgi:hypothetical protein